MSKFFKYEDFEQRIILLKGIADIHPYELILPDAPKPEKIINYGKKADAQYFQREYIPADFRKIDMLVKSGQITREQGTAMIEADKDLTAFCERLWRIRLGEEQVFQYIRGVPTYISPTYWFYLNFWHLDTGLPDFRTDKYHNCSDLEEFYCWDLLVVPSDFCYGLTELSSRRGGKCFGKDTPIRMYDGRVKMVQNIIEGDLVMGDDSTKRNAYGITHGKEKMYRIVPNKGDAFECNESHILSLYYNGNHKSKFGWEKQSVVNIPVKDYIILPENEKDHLCLYRTGWGGNFKENKHYISPYVLGVYLGDGCQTSGNITNIDEEILSELRGFCQAKNLELSKMGITYRIKRKGVKGSKSLSIIYDGQKISFPTVQKMNDFFKWGHDSRKHLAKWFKKKHAPEFTYDTCNNPYTEELRRLHLLHNKHIPIDYLIDCEKNRLQLLAGLLDTDGSLKSKHKDKGKTCRPSYVYEIIQKNKTLALQIVELARSLGFYVSIKPKKATLKRPGKTTYECEVWRVSIYGAVDKIPCRVERKKIDAYTPRCNSLNTGFKIEDIGIGDYYGFAVDKNHLFLLADGTVVHNTFKMGAIVYEPIARNYEWHGYIQSKTDLDAERAFTKAVVKPWRKLPFIFQPIYSNSSFPKKEGLQFTPRSRSSKEGAAQLYDEEVLMSEIVYVSSDTMAIDGQKGHRIGEDETGKGVVDTYERWNVNKFTLKDKGRLIGKAFHPTTVEEMEKKGGKYYKAKWDDSDRNPNPIHPRKKTVDENGETISGLWQWFMPSYCNEIFNEWGISIVDKITERERQWLKSQHYPYWQMCGMEAVDHQINKQPNIHKRQEIIRKKPRNIKEAFQSANTCPYFNADILNKRLAHFVHGYTHEELPKSDVSVTDIHRAVNEEELSGPGLRWGKFEPVDIEKPFGDMKFTPTDYDNARCHVNYLLPPGMRNKRVPMPGGKFKPANTAMMRSGADPFKYDTPDVKNPSKMSTGAQHIYLFYDELIDHYKPRSEWISNNFIYEYYFRPESVDELCYDYACACIYYGCCIYPERNNSDVLDYFKRNGLEHYIQIGLRITYDRQANIHYKQDVAGGDITGEYTIQKMFRHVQNFVNEDAAYCVFHRTLHEIQDVERENLNPYDLFVSAAYTLMAAYESDIANSQLPEKSEFGLEHLEQLNGYVMNRFDVPDYVNERYSSN